MNWLILIIAGLCETAFAFCLGKTKLAVGTEFWAWQSFISPISLAFPIVTMTFFRLGL